MTTTFDYQPVAAWEEAGYYFRIADKHAEIFRETSVELPESEVGTREDIATAFGYADFAALSDALEDPFAEHEGLFWDEEGHFGPGLYYAGVCCSSSYSEMLAYCEQSGISREVAFRDDLSCFVFEGEYVADCRDGDVVNPSLIVAQMPLWLLIP